MNEDALWQIFVQLVMGLRYIHEVSGVVHRDLTPNNIMLDEIRNVKITDFGLARSFGGSSKDAENKLMTSVVGTIVYVCPEIIQHQPYGSKADVWSLGTVFERLCLP